MSAPSAPASANAFLELLRRSEIVRPDVLAAALEELGEVPTDPGQCAAALIRAGLITKFQAKLLLTGRFRGFKVGPYVILDQIGQGGMGAVFLGEHETLHRKVAIKVLTTGFGNKLAVERFLREARSAAALDHPNIVRIFDVFKAADNHYLVMEYVEGETLEQVVSRGEPIACGRAATYISQAAAGLQHAYEKGFVHRDIKPANLMLAKDGTIKILDMGLARQATGQSDKLTEVMDQGAIVGTADFISPEQAMNAPQIDIRADIYSLGATFFALVVGKPPFDGNTTQKLIQHQLKEAPSLVSIDRTFPPGLAAVIATMLRKKPEDRFQTPAEVISALAPWLPNSGQAAKVLAGLSSSDLTSSVQLQNTLNQVMSGGTKRMTAAGLPATARGPKLPPAVVGVAAALVAVVAVGGVYLAFGGTKHSAVEVPPEVLAKPLSQKPGQSTPGAVDKSGRPDQAVGLIKPVVAGAGRSGYRLSLAGQKPFTVWGTGTATGVPTRDMRLAEAGRTGPGDWPAGWHGTPYGSVEAEYTAAEVDGRMALGMRYRNPNGDGKPMILGPDLPVPPGPCKVKFEYKTALPTADALIVRFKSTGPGAVTTFDVSTAYPGSPDEWKAVEFDADLRGADTGFFELHLNDTAPGQTLWVRAFEYGTPSAATAGAVAFRWAAADLAPFRNTKRGRDLIRGTAERMAPGTYLAGWKPDSESEFWTEDGDGGRAVGIANLRQPPSAQLGVELEGSYAVAGVSLQPGREYVLRVTYKTVGGGRGRTYLQTQGTFTQVPGAEADLRETYGQWKTVEVTWTKPADPVRLVVDCHTTGTDNALLVREVAVLDAAPATQPAYAVDFAATPTATETVSRQYTGNMLGGVWLPDGVEVNHYAVAATGTYMLADVFGGRALGLKPLTGTNGNQVRMLCNGVLGRLAAGESATVRLTYATTGGGVASVAVQRGEDPWTKHGQTPLPATNSQWAVLELPFTRPAEGQKYEVIVAARPANGAEVWIKSIEVFAGPPAATAAAGRLTPLPQAAVAAATSVTPSGQTLAAVDFAGVTAFRAPFTDGKFADAIPPFPPGVSGSCWKMESAAEFRGETADGPALGLTNLNDTLSAQLNIQFEDGLGAVLKPGTPYAVWVEYKTTNEAAGEVLVRTPDYNPVAKAVLAGTNGQWKWAKVAFTRGADAKLHAVIENTSIGEGNTVWVRKFEVRE